MGPMPLSNLSPWWRQLGLTPHLEQQLELKGSCRVGGLAHAARPAVAAGLKRPGQALVVVVKEAEDAKRWVDELEAWGLPALAFPLPGGNPYEGKGEEEDWARRMAVLNRMEEAEPPVLVLPARSLCLQLPPPEVWRAARFALAVGDELAPAELVAHLVRLGYRPAAQVNQAGEFARRGGLVDFFPPGHELPVRVEWFGDEVEGLRTFEVESQRSLEAIASIQLTPSRPLLQPEGGWPALAATLKDAFARSQKQLSFVANRLKAQMESDLERLSQFAHVDGAERYAPFVYPEMACLADHLPEGSLLLWEDREAIEGLWAKTAKGLDALRDQKVKAGELLRMPYGLHRDPSTDRPRWEAFPWVDFATVGGQVEVLWEAPPAPRFHSEFDQIAIRINQWQHEGHKVVVLTGQPQRVFHILDERGVNARLADPPTDPDASGGGVWVLKESLSEGFLWPSLKLVVLTDLELFGQHRRSGNKGKGHANQGRAIAHVAELKPGDYVVHSKHGVGRFVGLTKLEVDGQSREYLSLLYASEAKLYVPAEQIDTLHRYRAGSDGGPAKLHKLGGTEWGNAKARVKKGLEALAEDLVKLYGERAKLEGHAYPPDSPWQQEMEEAFPFELTIDQRKAVEETKRDMERPRPMDRLICGDVGFGKTEVALRATFKAVMAGKQVVILAPTTVLAQQHYLVFKERFAPYPIRLGLLSRFRSPKEQREVVAKLKTGEIDVVVGTHRLLSKDMGFKDLGLVVIDEEHRFGVANKERLKSVKRLVDVMTMSATPIPRTLYMALSGARDMSLIATPPLNRQPVKTVVGAYEPELIRDAIRYELGRGGQVFFLHNRVESIGRVLEELAQLVPEARVGVLHGQMPEDRIEDQMLAFKEGEFDLLLCTAIVESGLDIPRANTIIIDDADTLGLAQLYQMRGRVGRSETKAYCYAVHRKDKQLSSEARDRLQALQQFTALGSGYQIAMRDLEIRGVGNLLGPEQHGHMISVGFDTYTQMLEEAVEAARGEEVSTSVEATTVDLHVAAYLPDDYLGEATDKMAQYRRLAGVSSAKELAMVESEWKDRFGPIPPTVRNLLRVVGIKLQATELGLGAVRSDAKHVHLVPRDKDGVSAGAFYKAQAKDKALLAWQWSPGAISLNRERLRPEEQLTAVERLLEALGSGIMSPV